MLQDKLDKVHNVQGAWNVDVCTLLSFRPVLGAG